MAITLADPCLPVDIELERQGKTVHAKVRPLWNRQERVLMIGISLARLPKIFYGGLAHFGQKQLQKDDVIRKVGSIQPKFFYQVEQVLIEAKGKPIELLVERKVGEKTEQMKISKRAYLIIRPEVNPGVEPEESAQPAPESVLGLRPRCKLLIVEDSNGEGDPQSAWPLDVIVGVANIVNPSKQELADYFTERRGKSVELQVLRGGKKTRVKLDIPGKKQDLEALIRQIGVDDENAVVADTVRGTPAAKLNIPRGAKIVACAGRPVDDWCDIVECLRDHRGKQVKLDFAYGDTKFTGTLDVPAGRRWGENINYVVDMMPYPVETTIRTANPIDALVLGVRQTWYFVKMVYITLRRITIDKSIDPKHIGGPIFIMNAGRTVAEAGIYRFLYFLGLISANLAVINFLPIPVVDGGLMLLLLYEKLRGKPLPPRATAVWQAVGLALIVLAFVAITYNDIRRIITGE